MKEKIIDRIKKLLALAASSNEHEAANAAARAAELMVEHQIEMAEVNVIGAGEETPEPMDSAVTDPVKNALWKGIISHGIALANGCGSLYARAERGKVLKFYGPASAVAACVYVFHYLVNEVERLADAGWETALEENPMHSPTPGEKKRWTTSFKRGAAGVIQDRLKTLREDTFERMRRAFTARGDVQKSTALVLVKAQAQEVVKYGREKFNIRGQGFVNIRAGVSDANAYERGKAAGRDVNLGGNRALGAGARQLRA